MNQQSLLFSSTQRKSSDMNCASSLSSSDMDGAYPTSWWNLDNSSFVRSQHLSPNSAALPYDSDSPLASPLVYARSPQPSGTFPSYSSSPPFVQETRLQRAFGFPPQNNIGVPNPSQIQTKQWSNAIESQQMYDATSGWPLEPFDWTEMLLISSPASSEYTLPSPSQSPPALRYLLPCPSPSPSLSSGASASGDSSESTSPRAAGPVKKNGKICSHCSATSTPLWRRDPTTHQPLCNACGLYLAQRNAMRPAALIAADRELSPSSDDLLESDRKYDPNAPECSHCHTQRTSVWRRSKTGAKLCNACGVYQRLRGRDRPLSLRKNRIRPRCKHPKKQA